jgi:hypothetical protein
MHVTRSERVKITVAVTAAIITNGWLEKQGLPHDVMKNV